VSETETPTQIRGLGHSVRRKEDDRFIRGKGTYVDDVKLPGMLHLALLRSPLAHARITSIDPSGALATPGVVAVITGRDLAAHNLAWMPTLSGDTQAVLALDKVLFQGQEVAAVVATDPYVAADALEGIEVDYEPLPPVVDPKRALDPDAPLLREDKEGQTSNHIFHWEAGDKEATDRAFAQADRVVTLDTFYPRCHPAPLETCGCVADVNPATGKATIWLTSQAPHAHRTLFALVAGLPEQNIRIISPDIGGGFGNKVPIYPGYVVATVASLLLGKPVKWVEDRTGNLISTGFARDYHMHGEMALDADGRILGLRSTVLADHGAFNAAAQPSKFPAGLFHIFTGSYDVPAAFCEVDGVYTNKAPGGIAYRCSFRVTEASFLIERLAHQAATELGVDPAEFRRRNFIKPEQFPYHSPVGWVYDSGDYGRALDLALEKLGYEELRREQAERRARGELMGIGIASFTEVVGAGHGAEFDIAGLRMFDSAELRVHPTGKAILKLGVRSQGQGHETTFAQIVANELGIPPEDVAVVEGDTDNTPYGLGTYASRSTPVGGAATAMVARKLRDKARKIAAHLLEVAEEDVEFADGRFSVRGAPDRAKTIQEVAFAAYSNLPEGMEAGLEGVTYYDPPNMTFPFGTYCVVVDVDRGTGQWKVRKMVAVDDCGVRINPMIVEGQIHGGLTEGFGIAAMELITFDEQGNCIGQNFTDYLLPTSWETPRFETYQTVTPSPHHPIGAKGVGESATVGSPAAYVNAVLDALEPLGITNIDMPLTSDKVWAAIQEAEARRAGAGAPA
jgi:carbon-monoxide dehydrogenase large subunit